ncbi:dimethylarginine dimethylaminohydrolase family protein [Streptomyces sp. NPDC004111]|uniref:dimethylarginine dimethylaminohydrolase family protein n=1 Tax=Streptomyces sp. NPDC004111 TaxID=3364690 RepID=UPI003679C56A
MRERMPQLAGKLWSDGDPEGFARCAEQMDALAAFLEARGITVHRPRQLSDTERAVHSELSSFTLQQFVRDPILVIGDHVVESAMRAPYRVKERYGLRPLIGDLVARGARHVAVPPGLPVPHQDIARAPGPFLEGGDVLLFGSDILVGVGEGGFASDLAGARWLGRYLERSHRVHPVRLHPRVLHLDDGLSAVREGLAVVAREQFVDGIPPLLADWDLIEVSLDDALELLGANMLVLGPGEVVVDSRMTGLAEELTRHGVTVHTRDYDAVTPFAGGFRCSHHPVRRVPAP